MRWPAWHSALSSHFLLLSVWSQNGFHGEDILVLGIGKDTWGQIWTIQCLMDGIHPAFCLNFIHIIAR